MEIALGALVGYAIGAIPFGYVLPRLAKERNEPRERRALLGIQGRAGVAWLFHAFIRL